MVVRTFRFVFVLVACADACSYVEIPVPDASAPNGTRYVIGRTNELGNILGHTEYEIAVHPRGEYNGKFGYVGLQAQLDGTGDLWVVADGMNEEGLSMGAQTLRGSEYQFPSFPSEDILAQDLIPTILRNCADVNEALAYLDSHHVVGPAGAAGLHWAIADANGRSIVLEYLYGKRIVWENTPRVMTNDPPLDWHWRNLDTYVNLSPEYPKSNDFISYETSVGTIPRAIGHGFNLFGLPGDSSPSSRYAQLFYLREYALKTAAPRTVDDAVVLGSALLNKVFIPLGTVAMDERLEGPEYTPFALIKVPSERRILIRAYRNLQWKQVNLTKLDFTKSMSWPVEDGTLGIKDITSEGVHRDVAV